VHEKGKIAVLGIHPGSLLNYWSALNELGHYSVVLSGSVEELVELLERGERFELLLVDDLGKSLHTRSLELLAWYEAIGSIIAVADANSQERQALFRWARAQRIPLLGVLQAPFRPKELARLMSLGGDGETEPREIFGGTGQ
jgi:CheY-like chemotaxis protein